MTRSTDNNKLADLRFEYELLTNELFHLVQFTSLVDFDPVYQNESESFRDFLSARGLNVANLENQDDLKESNASRRMKRRRQLTADDTNGKGKVWESVLPIVEEKYDELSVRFSTTEAGRKTVRNGKRAATAVEDVPKSTKKSRSTNSNSIKKAEGLQGLPCAVVDGVEVGATVKKDSTLVKKQTKSQSKRRKVKKESFEANNDKETDGSSLILSEAQPEIDEFYFTTSSEDEVETNPKRKARNIRPRIKIHVNLPVQTVTNPEHVFSQEYKNVHEFLESYRSLDEDVSQEQYDKYIAEQRRVVGLIRRGYERGAILYDEQLETLQPISLRDVTLPSNAIEPISAFYNEQSKHVFQDHLINQGVVMSKIFQDNKRARISRARKVSQWIESHFKHIAGAEERKLKDEERRRKNLARFAMQAVKKRWAVAERALKVLQKDELDRLERIQGKQHLTEMLEQSTQLLGAQLNRLDKNESAVENSASGEIYSDSEESISGVMNEEGNEEDDVMSTSSSSVEADGDSIKNNENDINLSLEELKSKYAKLDEFVLDGEDDHHNSLLDEDSESSSSLLEDSDLSASEEEVSDTNITHEETPGLSALLGNVSDDQEDDEVNFSDPVEGSETSEVATDTDLEEASSTTIEQSDRENAVPGVPDSDPLAVPDVPVPSLLRGTLRTYQKQGLNWLASLYNNRTNGILADEMGLGKTIQTISLLAYLACEKENWGPHLIIVPTSVLLNWEMEFKRFAPGFKVLTYYGSPQQRKEKRKGWNKPDAFHICITSYQLVVHDQHSFKRKKWQYMILDEAHNIKNFRSTRWQALLNFNTERRLLLTGTPLQNNLAELWSLLYFLMPQTALENGKISGFADLEAFQQWFGRPVDKIVETGENYEQDLETKKTVGKLHQVLRPYLLRRLKADVEKQMPGKYEHIVYCKLSKRQRFLYDDFMSRAQTKETLASGNFMSIINCLMQLRKVCNHPDLFEVRPILTSFCIENSVSSSFSSLNNYIFDKLNEGKFEREADLIGTNFIFTSNDFGLTTNHAEKIKKIQCIQPIMDEIRRLTESNDSQNFVPDLDFQDIGKYYEEDKHRKIVELAHHLDHMHYLNGFRCQRKPMYGSNLINLLTLGDKSFIDSDFTKECIRPLQTRLLEGEKEIEKFAVVTPSVVTLDTRESFLALDSHSSYLNDIKKDEVISDLRRMENPFHFLQTKLSIAFPDKSLLQYDCGKLQKLAHLLQDLKDNGHRALIFTQMTKVLDVLEQFLNFHGYLYMRLDGSTKIEDRQILTERFNSDPRVTVFILSSRSGGLGINLTGADTVIFYDSDWNPAMDKQCQDRCHRIGQTRDVHIYRFVSEHTIESNILKKANQKRHLDNVVIQTGDFTTDYLTKLSVKDMLGSEAPEELSDERPLLQDDKNLNKLLAQAEDEDDAKAAKSALREVNVDNEDFLEDNAAEKDSNALEDKFEDDYGGTGHVEEYMIRTIANGLYY